MRVHGAAFMLVFVASLALATYQHDGKTTNHHNQHEALGQRNAVQVDTTLSGQEVISPTVVGQRSVATQPSVSKTATAADEESGSIVEKAIATSQAKTQNPLPRVDGVSSGQGKTYVTFYYCQRTEVNREDDGGGYCGVTRSGISLHPGSAACSYQWTIERRRFTVEEDPRGLTYTCEDTGSAIDGNHVDLWLYTNREGWEWPASRDAIINWLD